MVRTVQIGGVRVGGKNPLALIAGPCVIESRRACVSLAGRLARLAEEEGIPFIFKASYDKANRTSVKSYRGPGLQAGLDILAEVKERYGVPVLTDFHRESDAAAVAKVADAIQIPAFLCRQTDLVLAAAETGRPVNIKKGQFLAPWDVRHIVEKIESTGNRSILITERGATFGYNNLVADMRSLPMLRKLGYPVIFDATHSVQLPGAGGGESGGESWLAPFLARAAVAAGCDALFVETHVAPQRALSDKGTSLRFGTLRGLWRKVSRIDEIVR